MIKVYKAKIFDFTQADYTKEYSLLDCAIKEKIDKKKSDIDKKLSLAGYILLRRGVKELYNLDEVNITFNDCGKPLCDCCCFNISHSVDRAVCAFSDNPIGIDIQKIREIKRRKKYKFFTDDECDYVNKDDEISKRYIEIFSKKEAAIKMLGTSFAKGEKINVFSNKFVFKTETFDDFLLVTCTKNVSIM